MQDIEAELRQRVARQIRVQPEGRDRYRVLTPFQFPDGDRLAIVLRQIGTEWILSDEGHTLMHLSYAIDEEDLAKGGRGRIIDEAIKSFGLDESDGELALQISDGRFGDALFDYVQALLKVTDVTYLTRERVQSTFLEDLHHMFARIVPEPRRAFRWHEPQLDPDAKYEVDVRVVGANDRPLYVLGLNSDDKVRDGTITLQQITQWRLPGTSLGIFENQQEVSRKVLARFTDHVDRQFSTLAGNEQRITDYITSALEGTLLR